MTSLDLSVIGNCQIAVLVDARGRFVWGCFPRFDGDPVFCSLMAGEETPDAHGFFEIGMNGQAESSQGYIKNTAILSTTLTDNSGAALRILDFAPRYMRFGRRFHPLMLVRQIAPVRGAPAIRIRLRPAADYGSRRPKVMHGSNHIRYEVDDQSLRLTTNVQLSAVLEERVIVLQKPITMILGPDEPLPESPEKVAREMHAETQSYWEKWTRALSIPFEWQNEVIRAAITLKLCTYEDTGAVLAALTTSIPEAPGSGRNWDYRFCWLRDSYYTIRALNRLGATRTMEQFLRYIFNIVAAHGQGKPLQPVYGISGEPSLDERVVPGLAGYRGLGPVRVGNDAYRQTQNDSYGATILAATQSFFDERLVDHRGSQEFEWLETLGERAIAAFDKPDAGLWEYRARSEIHTYSSVMCWAACDRLARIATRLGIPLRAEYWSSQANVIHAAILENAWSDKRQSFASSFGGESIDASLLTLAEIGFIAPQDPRFLATLATIERELTRGPHLFRYVSEDDFGAPSTAFNICTFWYINALAIVGRKDEARELFLHMLACRTKLGLLSEDIDPATGELWGNFPQTYSMVGVIVAAMRLSQPWSEAI
jgi:GH15 family glucan-1,4-alpha-glucosidase